MRIAAARPSAGRAVFLVARFAGSTIALSSRTFRLE
jgi:hypothetical protein